MTTLPPGSVIGSVATLWLHKGWRLGRTAPGAVKNPSQLAGAGIEWHDAVVPGTVAAAIHKDINLPGDYDADDWWYQLNWGQTTFCHGAERAFPHAANSGLSPIRHYLRFDGLATLAEVWLNGTPILSSRNMFVTHRVDVTGLLREQNELVICFRSLGEALKQRRARPRWKTQLVNHQNLRWFRTTLLGRIPGWTPAISPVGPWAPIGIESVDRIEMESLAISATRDSLTVKARVSAPVDQARVRIGDREYPLTVAAREIRGEVAVDAPAWWPHTHGEPHLVSC